MGFELDVAIMGGCGRAGLPLGIAFADRGLKTAVYDLDSERVKLVSEGGMPFQERGADEVLSRVTGDGTLIATTDVGVLGRAEHVIVTVGTPIDEHLNPNPDLVPRAVDQIADLLSEDQILILRSTVFPGVTEMVARLLKDAGKNLDISFCPERIAEGNALAELAELPQIVSGTSERAVSRADSLFGKLTSKIVHLEPAEAELAKLFTNSWRYIHFAIANQMYMIANDQGLDFDRIRKALSADYPRAADFPKAGFAAGPCLVKDTMQLAAFYRHSFVLGHAAMMVNEGLPLYVVDRLEKRFDLQNMVVGILGMTFKADSDDTRSSLSYKLKKTLLFKTKEVLCTDPFAKDDPSLLPLEEVVGRSDLLVIGAPHTVYRELDTRVPIVDIWGLRNEGVAI